jgi:hypothetical protein
MARRKQKNMNVNTKENTNMTTTNSGIIETVKDKSVAAVKGTENIVETTVDAVAQIATTTVKDAAKVGVEIGTAATGLAKEAIGGVEKLGVKTEHASAAVVVGAVKAVGEVATAAIDTVRPAPANPVNNDKEKAKSEFVSSND